MSDVMTDEMRIEENSDSDVIRDRAIRLFQFLRELSELRTKTIRTLDQYEEVIWLSDIPKLSNCYCIAWNENATSNTDVWIEISKPILLPPPNVPDDLYPWVDDHDIRDSSREMPKLAERIIVEEKSEPDEDGNTSINTVVVKLVDYPDIQRTFETYIKNKWMPWAEHDRPLQQVQKIYTRLYSLYQQQQRLGEAYEVLLGVGYLTWRTPNSQVIKRHIITAQVAITFDAIRGKITIGPAAEGAKPELEQDMLEADERPDANELRSIEGMFGDMGDAIWEDRYLHSILNAWINTITDSMKYDESLDRQQDATQNAQIRFAPAIILRKRTERSLVRAFKEICDQLGNQNIPVPKGVADIVRDPDTSRPAFSYHSDDLDQGAFIDDEIYFPLPANDKQIEIARRINTHQGVLVQGPPGTGKSHTIANLVCHLLASGKRVLVTSHTTRALDVLQEKFPKDIAPLCVMALGDDTKSMKRLESSVQGILAKDTSWDDKVNNREIEKNKKDVHGARKEEAQILLDLRAIREAETYHHPAIFGGYEGTLQTIAQRIHAEESEYNWLEDIPEEQTESPLNDEESLELLALMRQLDYEKIINTNFPIINIDDLIHPSQFYEIVKIERDALERYDAAIVIRERPEYTALSACDNTKRNMLVSALQTWLDDYEAITYKKRNNLIYALQVLLSNYDVLAQNINPWVKDIALRVLASQEHSMTELHLVTEAHLLAVKEHARATSELTISGLSDRDRQVTKSHASALLKHIQDGGKLRHWTYIARPKVVKDALYLIDEVCVNGLKCAEIKPLQELLEWIDFNERLDALDTHWCNLLTPPKGSMIVRMAEYENYNTQLKQCLELKTLLTYAQSAVSDIPGLREPIWHQPANIVEYKSLIETETVDHRMHESSELQSTLKQAKSAVSDIPGLREPIWNQTSRIIEYIESSKAVSLENNLYKAKDSIDTMYNQITMTLRNQYHELLASLAVAVQRRDESTYSESYISLVTILDMHRQFIRSKILLQKLLNTAPKCHNALLISYKDSIWDTRLASFTAAWNWSKTNQWLIRMSDPKEQKRLEIKLEDAHRKTQNRLAALASAKAWRYCISRLTEAARSSLVSWQLNMRSLRKGHSIHAERYRRNARMYLEQCRSAIPAWIMPIYRVAETIEMSPDIFDVVIVDEASQSGPEALFLQFLAKTIIVVGDEKQIKPQFVGIDSNAVELLRQRIIPDVPHSDLLGVNNSFFDQARIRYASPICLREHFRCMPEIIQFCNNLCYQDTPLIPLKQYGAGRLSPTIQVRHVKGGYQKGRSPKTSNLLEAEKLVEQVCNCCSDIAYKNKSMGVISLLGEQQAKLIQSLLVKKLGPEAMEVHDIHCGDAYAFQGDERDVIFLSMVSSVDGDGHYIGTLASEEAEKRFNVAVSRAKEQLWLFHTATINDLSKKCLRYQLLEYCNNATIRQTQVPGTEINIDQLRSRATTAKRNIENPPHPFDSWFEVDVFLRIHERGYRVLPQQPIAGYYIDLVIEGMKGRLAVECDGDEWHGPDRYQDDMARQRQLERSGYIFWRVRGSTYYHSPTSALESLWQLLDQLHIYPDNTGDSDSTKEDQTEAETDDSESKGNSTNESYDSNDNYDTNDHYGSNDDYDTNDSDIDDFLENSDTETIISSDIFISDNEKYSSIPKGIISYICYTLPRSFIQSDDPDEWDLIQDEICDLVDIEGPIHIDHAVSRISQEHGVSRVTEQISSVFMSAVMEIRKTGKVQVKDLFLYPENHRPIALRIPSEDILSRRPIEWICNEELLSGLLTIIKRDKNINKDSLIAEIVSLLQINDSEQARFILENVYNNLEMIN